MADDKRKILTEATQAVIMAIGREKNAIEFYSYLAEAASMEKPRNFFRDMVQRETEDMLDLEALLQRLEKEGEEEQTK